MGMDRTDLDDGLEPGPLLAALDRNGVDFVVIGGLAGLAQGSSYPTFDLDVAYSRDKGNLRRMAAALGEIGVALRGEPVDLPFQVDDQTLATGSNFTFATAHGSFDILGEVDGLKSYEALRRHAKREWISGVDVLVASLDDLIAMKRAANRVKDQLMVLEYVELADEIRRQEEGAG
jgi:hypothetical protein